MSYGIVGGRRKIMGLKHPLKFKYSIVSSMREFSFLYLMLFVWRDDAEMGCRCRFNGTKHLWVTLIRTSIYQELLRVGSSFVEVAFPRRAGTKEQSTLA